MKQVTKSDVIFLGGAAAVFGGLYAAWPPLAWLFGGLLVMVLAVLVGAHQQ